jgi:sigma-B regulation protein RsbU (phosphoserine phosphatase)
MSPQEDLLLVIAGTAIFTVGVLSLCAHFTSALSREKILLWFGLFAAPYGLALICRSVFLPGTDGRAEPFIVIVGKLVGLVASIPALLLFQEFYGTGWRLSSKWLTWIYALALLGVLCLMAIHERPRSIPSPGITLVILVPLVLLVNHIAGYHPPPIKGRLAVFTGLLAFFLSFSYDHLAHWRAGNVRATTEPLGFIVLMFCLGYVVSRRVAINESEWLSMSSEMRAARRIQTAILPSTVPTITGYSVAARYSPMTAVAGDYYGFPQTRPACMGIILADALGHGVAAALVASMVKVSVFASAENQEGPANIIGDLNATLCKEASGQFATAVYLSLNRESGVGKYSAAGHPPPLLWRHRKQQLQALDTAGLLLGVRSREVFIESDFTFEAEDRLLVYSDGLTEAENKAGVSFGDSKLSVLLAEKQILPVEQFATTLLEEVLAWSTHDSEPSQSDDITFVVVDLQ